MAHGFGNGVVLPIHGFIDGMFFQQFLVPACFSHWLMVPGVHILIQLREPRFHGDQPILRSHVISEGFQQSACWFMFQATSQDVLVTGATCSFQSCWEICQRNSNRNCQERIRKKHQLHQPPVWFQGVYQFCILHFSFFYIIHFLYLIPVVPHKAVAEVSNIGNL